MKVEEVKSELGSEACEGSEAVRVEDVGRDEFEVEELD